MAEKVSPDGHAFISYVHEDARQVDTLQERLKNGGVPVWRDTDMLPGQDWRAEIRRAIREDSLVFLACFSRQSASRDKSYQNEELSLAMEQIRLRRPDVPWLIPVRFDDCEIPDWDIGAGRTIGSIQRADLFGDSYDAEADRLVVAVRRILGRPSGKPRQSPWPERKVDAEDIESLNPREAARRLALARPDDAVRALRGASASASGDALAILLKDNEALAVALLAMARRDKARELIGAIPSAPGWLKKLPEAADAVERCEQDTQPMLGQITASLSHAGPSPAGTHGFCQDYESGQVLWSPRGGAQATAGIIGQLYRSMGGSTGGPLGFPLTAEFEAQPSEFFGTTGTGQRFEFSADYGLPSYQPTGLSFGATIYCSAAHGAHPTWGSIGKLYENLDGTGGWLGFPTSGEEEAGPSRRDDGNGTTGLCQRFEGGSVYYSHKTKAIAVPARIASHIEQHHSGVTGSLGFPVSPEMTAGQSPYSTDGHFQRFEGRWDYPQDIITAWTDLEGPGGATIYTSETNGTHCVGWGNGSLYEQLGGTTSWLGFPKSDETDARTSPDEPWRTIQEFEGGAVFYTKEHGSVTVPKATVDYLADHPRIRQQLGVPVKRSRTSPPDAQVQFFEHGVVTNNNGLIEAWLRPDVGSGPQSEDAPHATDRPKAARAKTASDGRRTGGGRSASKMERLAIALTRAAGSEPGDDSSYRGAQEQLSQMPARTAADVLNRLSVADASAALWSLRAYDARWCADVLDAMADERASEILQSATFRDRYRLPRTARIQQLLLINAPAQRRSTPKRRPG